jgi:hypothetical protein
VAPRLHLGNTISRRYISSSSSWKAFDGSKPEDHVTQKKDKGNVQHEVSKQGKAERASGGESAATSEEDKDNKNDRAKKEHPEAPDVVIGMNDERGGVSMPKL